MKLRSKKENGESDIVKKKTYRFVFSAENVSSGSKRMYGYG